MIRHAAPPSPPMSFHLANARARAVDLVVLPPNVPGTSCGNCMYFDAGANQCRNPRVAQGVQPHWCCALWDAHGVERVADLRERSV